jgi:NAD(P) transhydrogenase subunit alpha
MMMTAAGTFRRRRCFVMGLASPACKRLRPRAGSAVTATDVRPPRRAGRIARRQFLAVEDEEFKNAQTAGGYAKEMSKSIRPSEHAHRRHIKKQDIIMTALIPPGAAAPPRRW